MCALSAHLQPSYPTHSVLPGNRHTCHLWAHSRSTYRCIPPHTDILSRSYSYPGTHARKFHRLTYWPRHSLPLPTVTPTPTVQIVASKLSPPLGLPTRQDPHQPAQGVYSLRGSGRRAGAPRGQRWQGAAGAPEAGPAEGPPAAPRPRPARPQPAHSPAAAGPSTTARPLPSLRPASATAAWSLRRAAKLFWCPGQWRRRALVCGERWNGDAVRLN